MNIHEKNIGLVSWALNPCWIKRHENNKKCADRGEINMHANLLSKLTKSWA